MQLLLLALAIGPGTDTAASGAASWVIDANAVAVVAELNRALVDHVGVSKAPAKLRDAARTQHPFQSLDVTDAFSATVRVGVLEWKVRGELRVQSLSLGQAQVDVMFTDTNTVGESKAWASVGQDLGQALGAVSAPDPLDLALQELRDPDACARTLRILDGSAYEQSGQVLRDALGQVAPGCQDALVSTLAARPQDAPTLEGWLVDQAAGSDAHQAIEWLGLLPDPGHDAQQVLNEQAARDAQDQARADAAAQDAKAQATQDLAAQLGALDNGPWTVETEVSPLDDSTNLYVHRRATAAVSGWPNERYTPELWLRCKEGEVSGYIVTGLTPEVEGMGERATITLRLDKETAFDTVGSLSNDRRGVFLPARVTADLPGHSTLLVQFTPLNSNPVHTTFDLTGVDDALAAVTATCAL
jgi:type VI secretion system protein VasI